MPTGTFLGEITLVPYNFAPRGYAFCQGQILSISQNTALFSLLGTTYGGDGVSTFGLPDLRGRCAVSQGQGPGLSNYDLGEQTGTETVTLTTGQMPAHGHAANARDDDPNSGLVTNNLLANLQAYSNKAANATLSGTMIGQTGGNQPHANIQPLLVLNYCIALQGIYPSRN
jgi:microcystin-dependent protein